MEGRGYAVVLFSAARTGLRPPNGLFLCFSRSLSLLRSNSRRLPPRPVPPRPPRLALRWPRFHFFIKVVSDSVLERPKAVVAPAAGSQEFVKSLKSNRYSAPPSLHRTWLRWAWNCGDNGNSSMPINNPSLVACELRTSQTA